MLNQSGKYQKFAPVSLLFNSDEMNPTIPHVVHIYESMKWNQRLHNV